MTTDPERVIVVMHSDGYVEVRSTSNVLAVCINRPHVSCIEAANKVDELLQNVVPWQYRDLLRYPGDIIARGHVEKITPSQALDTVHQVQLLNACKSDPNIVNANSVIWNRLGGTGSRRAVECPAERRERETKKETLNISTPAMKRVSTTMDWSQQL